MCGTQRALVTEPADWSAVLAVEYGHSYGHSVTGRRERDVESLGEGVVRRHGCGWLGELPDPGGRGFGLPCEGLGDCLGTDDADVVPGIVHHGEHAMPAQAQQVGCFGQRDGRRQERGGGAP